MSSPQSFFVQSWREVSQWKPSARRGLPAVPSSKNADLKNALSLDSAEAVHAALLDLAKLKTPTSAEYRAFVLQAMLCIDQAFARAHPRSLRLSTRPLARLLPQWLAAAMDHRREHGFYCEFDAFRLVPRGPLLRHHRTEHASFADSIADRFAFLSVVPKFVLQEEREVEVRMTVIDASAAVGVPQGASPAGLEILCAVPIAETRADLSAVAGIRGTTPFVKFGASTGLDAADKFMAAVRAASKSAVLDIVVGPEFLLDHADQQKAMNAIAAEGMALARMLLIGSGATSVADDVGRPWNEALVLNGIGTPLWRQRKLWPASIEPARAVEFQVENFPDPTTDQALFEDNASGDCVEIVDIDSVGRCAILICQDFESFPMCSQIVRRWQPDWIFVPILDRGMAQGGWFHQTAFDLSKSSRSRYVAVSSVALPRAGVPDPLSCVLIACPMDGEGTAPRGAFVCKAIVAGTSPGYALVDFSKETWSSPELKERVKR